MKKIIALGICAISFLGLKASHFAGGELLYRYVGDSTGTSGDYKITCILYGDVTGVPLLGDFLVRVDPHCIASSSHVLPLKSVTIDSIFDYCNIGGSSFNSYRFEKYVFSGIVNVSAPCPEVTFSYYGSDRNYPDNIVNNIGFYIEAKAFIKKNNSSLSGFNGPRLFHVNDTYHWPHLVYDMDGDSLFVELETPREFLNKNLSFSSGLSKTTPIWVNSTIGLQLDPSTGNIFFEPNSVQRSVLTLKISEYRFDSTQMAMVKIAERIVDKTAEVKINSSTNVNPLQLDSTIVNYDCSSTFIDVALSAPFLEFSLSKDATDFMIVNPLGQLVSVDSTMARNAQKFSSDSIRFFLHDSLTMNGEYKIISLVGTDGNTLFSMCNATLGVLDTAKFTVSNCPNISVVENQSIEYKVFPNPVKDVLRIKSEWLGKYNVAVFNAVGKLMFETKNDQPELEINMEEMPSGIYFIKIESERYSEVQKIIKQ